MAQFGFPYDQIPLKTQIDYVGGTNPIYIGTAKPGTAVSAAGWQIKKLTYDGNDNIISVDLATAGSITNIWNNRASLTYS